MNIFTKTLLSGQNKKTDGSIHESNLEYDQFSDTEMMNSGLHILRIKNEELLDIKAVLKKIDIYLNSIN